MIELILNMNYLNHRDKTARENKGEIMTGEYKLYEICRYDGWEFEVVYKGSLSFIE